MKIIVLRKLKIIYIIILLIILIYIFNTLIGNIYITTFLNINDCEIQNNLLFDAINYIGVCNSKDAVIVWSNGLKLRNAAMQYSVMTYKLKIEYKKQLEKTFPNWVTGISSPWVDSYTIIKASNLNNYTYIFNVKYTIKTSTGFSGDYIAILTVEKEYNFWRISNIIMDKGLYPYTGFSG